MTTEPKALIRVRTGPRRGAYPVYVEPGIVHRAGELVLRLAPAHRYVVISDANVDRLHGDTLEAALRAVGASTLRLVFATGESNKDRRRWMELTDRMVELGCGRDTAVLGFGGGVTTDLAGFVAATYMRGLPLVQVPTSVLAMVDASIGGKVGVNLQSGKNLVGAFHAPAAVVIDPAFVGTLSGELRVEGWVEGLKHGVVRDRGHFDQLVRSALRLRQGDLQATTDAVRASVQIKAEIVSADETDHGVRQLLNFGHTLGHALEAVSGWSLPHGRAVAIGMCVEAKAGELIGVTKPGSAAEIREALTHLGIEMSPPEVDDAAVLRGVAADKKASEGTVRYVIVRGLGEALPEPWLRSLPDAVVEEALAWYRTEYGRAVAGR